MPLEHGFARNVRVSFEGSGLEFQSCAKTSDGYLSLRFISALKVKMESCTLVPGVWRLVTSVWCFVETGA